MQIISVLLFKNKFNVYLRILLEITIIILYTYNRFENLIREMIRKRR